MTVTELCNSFMNRYARDRLRPTTIRGYQTNIDRHILPTLGEADIMRELRKQNPPDEE